MKKVVKKVAGTGAAIGTAFAYGSLLFYTWS